MAGKQDTISPGHHCPSNLSAVRVLDGREPLRILAVLLSLVAAGIHLVLAFFNLIPGENTTGAVFAGMGIGYLVGAVGILLKKALSYRVVVFYAIALILAYSVSRDMLPVEAIGILTKLDEGFLAISLLLLLRKQV